MISRDPEGEELEEKPRGQVTASFPFQRKLGLYLGLLLPIAVHSATGSHSLERKGLFLQTGK